MNGVKPTIDDVAALAGVARVTVSRVLNGGPNVSAKARDAVMAAVDKLQYKMNMQARFLAGGRSQVIGLVYPSDLDVEPNSFYYSGLEIGAMRACGAHGFQLMLHAVNRQSLGNLESLLGLIEERRYDGLILTPPLADDLALLAALKRRNHPVVGVSAGRAAQGLIAGVGIDDEAAGFEMTRHLLSLGHRRFGFIRGLEGHLSADDRFLGFTRALRTAGLNAEDMSVERGNFSFKSGTALCEAILTGKVKPTALICANDDMAVGAAFTAHKMGLNIPHDLSIVGFDDTPVSEIVWPPLTTVHQPVRAMGSRAVELLFGLINAGRLAPPDLRFERIPHRIVVRESAARPASPLTQSVDRRRIEPAADWPYG